MCPSLRLEKKNLNQSKSPYPYCWVGFLCLFFCVHILYLRVYCSYMYVSVDARREISVRLKILSAKTGYK